MGFMREFPAYFKNRLEFEQFTPLIKASVNVTGKPVTPASVGVTSARNSAVLCEYDKRAFVGCYDRLDIATFFTASMALKPVSITATNVKTARDLQPDLYRCLGIFPDATEIQNDAIVLNGNTVTIKPASDHWWFIGSLVVTLDSAYYTAADGTVIADLGTWDPRPFVHPTADPTTRPVMNGGLLTFNNDYTSKSHVFSTIPVRAARTWADLGDTLAAQLAAALNAVDGIPWVCNTAGTATVLYDYNLYKCSVIYNGPTEAFDPIFDSGFTNALQQYFLNYPMVNSEYSHVLIIHPNPGYGNKNLRYAPLFIHYGRKRIVTDLPYRKPKHDWSLLSIEDRGFEPAVLSTALTKTTDTDFGDFGSLTTPQLLPNGLSTVIGHTVSFEILRSAVAISTPAGLLAVGTSLASADKQTAGSIILDATGKVAIVGGTAGWTRDNVANTLNAGQYVEVHVVRTQNFYYIYINNQLCEIGIAPVYSAGQYIVLGKAGTAWLSTELVRNLRYWDIALSKDQIAGLNGAEFNGVSETNPVAIIDPAVEVRPYPAPYYEWLLDGKNDGSGIIKESLPGTWNYVLHSNDRTYGHLAGTAPVTFPMGLQMRMFGEYTYDMELDLADLPWGYVYLFTTSQTSNGAYGHLAYYDGRFYEYGITATGGVWATLTRRYGKVRLTIRSKDGTTSMYIDGVFQMSYPSGTYVTQWTGMRDVDPAAAQFDTRIGVRNIRYWSQGLTDAELASLFNTVEPPPPVTLDPVHWWKLNGNTTDSGKSPLSLVPAFTYYDIGGVIYAGRNIVGPEAFGNGITLPIANEFTFTMVLRPGDVGGYHVLLSTMQSSINYEGSIMMYNGRVYMVGVTPAAPVNTAIANNVDSRLTIRRIGTMITLYINGVAVISGATNATLRPWEGFGDIEYTADYSAPNKMREIAYWKRALTDEELAEFLTW